MWKIAILLCIIILLIYLFVRHSRKRANSEILEFNEIDENFNEFRHITEQMNRARTELGMPIVIVHGDDIMNIMQNELLNIVLRNHERPPRRRPREVPAEDFLRNMERHDDDSQNVHQSEINKLFVKKYNRLVELYSISDDVCEQALGEITYAAKKYINDDARLTKSQKNLRNKRIMMVLDKIREGNILTSISLTAPPKEDEILALVWLRIQSLSENENHTVSLFDNLLDCAPKRKHAIFDVVDVVDRIEQKYSVVCINGRVGRILGSLTLIDSDSILGAPEKDINTITNEAYAKAGHVYDKAIADYKNKNTTIRPAQEIYNTSATTPEETEELTLFENHIKNSIRDIITQDYSDILTPQKLSEIISSSQSVV